MVVLELFHGERHSIHGGWCDRFEDRVGYSLPGRQAADIEAVNAASFDQILAGAVLRGLVHRAPGMSFTAEAPRTWREEQEGQNPRVLRKKSPGCYYVVRMSALSRIGVAIDSVLLEKFDKLIGRRGYTNRSEAFRDLIREELVEEAWESPASHVVGTVTLVYDHHVRLLSEKLTAIQHDYHHSILSTLHVHLDHDHCLEVLVVRGQSAVVRKVADMLISAKGVKHGRLTITTTGKELK